MRAVVLITAVGGLMCGALAGAGTANADFTVCNPNGKTVEAAYGFVNPGVGGGFVTRGWRKIAPGGCEVLVYSSQTSDPHNYFVYAEEIDGPTNWPGDSPLCTTSEKFVIVGPQTADWCSDRGYKTVWFTHVESASGNHTSHLRGGTPPPNLANDYEGNPVEGE